MVKENNRDDGDVKLFPKITGITSLLKNEPSTSHCSENWPCPRSTYITELNLQICYYAQKRRICRENCKYVLDENLHGHFCPRWKAAKFCHPGNNDTCTVCFLFSKYPHMQRGKVVACVTQKEWSWRKEARVVLFFVCTRQRYRVQGRSVMAIQCGGKFCLPEVRQ